MHPFHQRNPTQAPENTAGTAAAAAALVASTSSSTTTAEAKPAAARPAAAELLKAAAPVDRLRYQGLLLFEHFDADKDGAPLLLPDSLL
jgi:hypothetical protein